MLQALHRGGDGPGPFLQAMRFDNEHGGCIGIAPDNRPPAAGRYLCFITVMDYWRLVPELCAQRGVAHFPAAIEPAVTQDLRAGRALLVLDLCNEGPGFDRTMFDAIHAFLDDNGIAGSQAVWLSQNRAVGRAYHEAYGGVRENPLGFEYYDFYIKLMAHWFATPSWRCKVTGDSAEYAAALNDPARKQRFALCLNATPRMHRVWTVAALHHFGILDRCLVSFDSLSDPKGDPLDPDQVASTLERRQLHFLRRAWAEVSVMPPLRVDNFADTGNQLVDKIDITTYLSTFFSIVTETDFSNGTIDRITEKTVKVFCLGHPAFVIGNPGALRFATDLGFQDFTPALPSDYDCIGAPRVRFVAVFAEILAQVIAIQTCSKGWLDRVSEVSRYNIHHAAGGLLRTYKDRHDKPVLAALEQRLAEAECPWPW